MCGRMNEMDRCRLCPRSCGAERSAGKTGYCRVPSAVKVARAALHMWEEPPISGEKGSGTVFFSGCALQCVYCQNRNIAGGLAGTEISVERLADIFLELQGQGAANINLVTAGHYIPQTAEAIRTARENGLHLPVLYNSSGYEKVRGLKMLEGLIDIYLPDFKYMDSATAKRYSNAPDYPEITIAAIEEMYRQTGECVFDGEGYLQKGVVVRHLVLPGHVRESKEIIRCLYETYGSHIYISIMNQFTPLSGLAEEYPEIGRCITAREYDQVVDFAVNLGVENGFIQEEETALESFIPEFDLEGVLPR